jgi:hypothetical protein
VSYFNIIVEGPAKDLHSGVFGGTVHEPMTDLIFLMNSLVKPDGEILIPGINDQVAALDAKESVLYKEIAFSMTELHDAIGSNTELFPDEKNTLMHRYSPLSKGDALIAAGAIPLSPCTESRAPFPLLAPKPSSPPASRANSPFEPSRIWNPTISANW